MSIEVDKYSSPFYLLQDSVLPQNDNHPVDFKEVTYRYAALLIGDEKPSAKDTGKYLLETLTTQNLPETARILEQQANLYEKVTPGFVSCITALREMAKSFI